jgi:7,8-dihydropterin-6-yl-methyl-4-(beta-D-ribofuranosyl)aminobenzene 5'-phosphate synthase
LCEESATADDVHAAMPHPVVGSAADPIALEPVDDVVVTTLVDNVYDALLTGDNTITRAPLGAGTAQAPQFEPGFTNVGLMAGAVHVLDAAEADDHRWLVRALSEL